MRHALAVLGLTALLATPAAAFEIERETLYGPAGAAQRIEVISTTDTDIFRPLVEGWLARRPDVALRYIEASSLELYRALADEGAPFDLAISSAMDLQIKLANDGFARPLSLPDAALPAWARWRDLVFAVAQEPAVLVLHPDALAPGEAIPRSRRELIALLRANPARFAGRIATYDPETSGVGYMFATQEARMTDAFWRLAEVMGRVGIRLYCCSVEMLDDLGAGRMLVGWNVLGSYAATRAAPGTRLIVVEPEDFTLTLLRTALVPASADRPDLGAEFLAWLLSPEGQRLFAEAARLPPVEAAAFHRAPHLRPIRLDPGLLVHLDAVIRQQFLAEWRAALAQR